MINDIGQANGAKTMILKMLHYNEKKERKIPMIRMKNKIHPQTQEKYVSSLFWEG